jgi:23S rRNA (cytidine1920-2'-O)/16S rRNA (cytidine1409-2'-O)-methyltransferase
MRLDLYIFQKFGLKSRSYAAQLIKKGQVKVRGGVVFSPAFEISDETDATDAQIALDLSCEFASQGGHKLKHALDAFKIDLLGLETADIGCSNGGFTDCMLRAGAKSVLAVDVGECALPENLKSNPRVTFLRENARYAERFPQSRFDFVCADVSFISVALILETVKRILKESGRAVILVKPQFELNKSALNKRGIVKSERDRTSALEKIKSAANSLGFEILGETKSPEMFENKNVEYLLYLKKLVD